MVNDELERRPEILSTVKMSTMVFWAVTPCGRLGR
jgi:hypothetical protein